MFLRTLTQRPSPSTDMSLELTEVKTPSSSTKEYGNPHIWMQIIEEMVKGTPLKTQPKNIWEVKQNLQTDEDESELKTITVVPTSRHPQDNFQSVMPILSSDFYFLSNRINPENKLDFQQKYLHFCSDIGNLSIEKNKLETEIEMLHSFLDILESELKTLGFCTNRNWNKLQILGNISLSLLMLMGTATSIYWYDEITDRDAHIHHLLNTTFPANRTQSCAFISSSRCLQKIHFCDPSEHFYVCSLYENITAICQDLCDQHSSMTGLTAITVVGALIGAVISLVSLLETCYNLYDGRSRRERLLSGLFAASTETLQHQARTIFQPAELNSSLKEVHQLASKRISDKQKQLSNTMETKDRKKVILSLYAKRLGLFKKPEEIKEFNYEEEDSLDSTQAPVVRGKTNNPELSQGLLNSDEESQIKRPSRCPSMCVIL